jgi:lysozyme family protein
LSAVTAVPADQLVSDYGKRRLSFMMDLPTWGTFGKGWGRRVEGVTAHAGKMIDDPMSNMA